MTAAAYQYLSDDGNTYQVILDSTFAAAMGYVAASGLETYLPSYISMRYCSYQSASGLLFNSVFFTVPFSAIEPPIFIVVGGISYALKSTYGEQRGAPVQPNLFTISGPQGAPGLAGATGATGATGAQGPPGFANVYSSVQPGPSPLTSGSFVSVGTLALPAGSYFLIASVPVTNGTVGAMKITVQLFRFGTSAVLGLPVTQTIANVSQVATVTILQVATLSAADSVELQVEVSTTGCTLSSGSNAVLLALAY